MKRIKVRVKKSRFYAWAKNAWSYMGIDDLAALFLFVIGMLGYAYWITSVPGGYIIQDLRAEMIGIGIGVFIIANAGEYVSRQTEKKRLILQMGSPDNAFAVEAVRQLAALGWLEDGSCSEVNLIGADLRRADLSKAYLVGANLFSANLSDANLSAANLSGTDLFGANLSGAFLYWANLSGARLSYTDLRGANLRGANLSGAELMDTKLSGAKYNKLTTWPDGFNPKAEGVEL